MNIKTMLRTLFNLPVRQSVLIEARHGVGKSEIIHQYAAAMSQKLNKPFELIDIRLGQYEVGDLIGIPRAMDRFTVVSKVYENGLLVSKSSVVENVTVHDLPLWFPRDPDSCGVLFMDELNRGSRDTQQWAMQIVLDYKSNFVELPIGWRVISAINNDQDTYSVMNIDPALYSRFMVIGFNPTIPEWLDWAEKNDVHDAIIKYIRKFGNADLDPPDKIESGMVVPCRRSWVKFSACLKEMAQAGDDPLNDYTYLIELATTFVGNTVAINFKEWVEKSYKVFTAEEILNNYPKLKEDFEKMISTDFSFYNKEIIDYIKKNKVKLSPKQGANLFEYIQTTPREVACGFFAAFRVADGKESAKWYGSNPKITEYIRGILDRDVTMPAK